MKGKRTSKLNPNNAGYPFRIFLLTFFFWRVGTVCAEITVATWNLHNYLCQDQWMHGKYRFNYPKPEPEKQEIRRLIKKLQPDILFLQELGGQAYLDELHNDLKMEGLEYPFSFCFQLREGERAMGMLAKIPVKNAIGIFQTGEDGETLPVRGILSVDVMIEDRLWQFYQVHLKSRYSEDPDDPDCNELRQKEMQVLMEWVAARKKASADPSSIVLVGDFNAPLKDPSLFPLGQSESWVRLRAVDEDGEGWTYFSAKYGSKETLDGFWVEKGAEEHFGESFISNVTNGEKASDHRLVMTRILK